MALIRAYANIADELEPAGYSAADVGRIKKLVEHYLNVREIIRKASGESLDLKGYEADMRHLIAHLHRGGRAEEDFTLRQHEPAGVDREDRNRQCNHVAARWLEG